MFNDAIAGKTFLRDALKHSRSFPARLKAEDLLRRAGNENIRIEKMIPKKRSCSTLLLGFNAMVFNSYAPRCNADPLRFAFSRVSRKEGKNDGLRKGFKKKMLQWLPSFFKKTLLWLKNKAP